MLLLLMLLMLLLQLILTKPNRVPQPAVPQQPPTKHATLAHSCCDNCAGGDWG